MEIPEMPMGVQVAGCSFIASEGRIARAQTIDGGLVQTNDTKWRRWFNLNGIYSDLMGFIVI